MAEEHRERDEGTAGMVERHERAVGNDVERLLAAVIGMRAPADVGEQARRVRSRRSSTVSSSPDDAMNLSVQAMSSSPWAGERERRRLSSLAAAINGSLARSSASSIE